MSVGPFKLRSSWPSSFVTGLIGWNGFFIIVALVLGEQRAAGKLFLLASIAAIAQVAFLRVLSSAFGSIVVRLMLPSGERSRASPQ